MLDLDGHLTGDLTCALHSATSGLTGSLSPSRRRYERWPDDERDRILAESFMPGRTVAQVARDNGVGLGLLHYWRRHARAAGAVEELRLVPVTVVEEEGQACASANLDLIIRDVTVRVTGAVDVERLRAVLTAIRG